MRLKFKFLGPKTRVRNYSSFSLKTGIQCRPIMNKHWGLKKKKAFVTLHESNLQHLINRHLRGCLQAISMHWQHISPGEENTAALLGGAHQHLPKLCLCKPAPGGCWLLVPVPPRGSEMSRAVWLNGVDPCYTLQFGLRVGTEWALLCFHLEATFEYGKHICRF